MTETYLSIVSSFKVWNYTQRYLCHSVFSLFIQTLKDGATFHEFKSTEKLETAAAKLRKDGAAFHELEFRERLETTAAKTLKDCLWIKMHQKAWSYSSVKAETMVHPMNSNPSKSLKLLQRKGKKMEQHSMNSSWKAWSTTLDIASTSK